MLPEIHGCLHLQIEVLSSKTWLCLLCLVVYLRALPADAGLIVLESMVDGVYSAQAGEGGPCWWSADGFLQPLHRWPIGSQCRWPLVLLSYYQSDPIMRVDRRCPHHSPVLWPSADLQSQAFWFQVQLFLSQWNTSCPRYRLVWK